MEPHAIKLPFDPTELLLRGVLQGLEMLAGIVDGLPWPVKLILAILIYVRIFGKAEKPKKSRARY